MSYTQLNSPTHQAPSGLHAIGISHTNTAIALAFAARQAATQLGASAEAILSDPRVTVVEPEAKKPTISRAQIANLQHELSLTSSADGVRIIIIHQAHQLGPEAANALLKQLEEPPTGVMFYLTTPSAARLLPTIKSRLAIRALTAQEAAQLTATLLGPEGGLASEAEAFIASTVPERFATIARLHAEGQLSEFAPALMASLHSGRCYPALAWLQDHPASPTASNFRLQLEALSCSEALA